MTRRHPPNRLLSWIACLAILFSSLAMPWSHALAGHGADAGTWVHLCTPDGTLLVKLDADGNASTADSAPAQPDHCPFCAKQDLTGLPPAPLAALPPVRGTAFPVLFLLAPHPLFAWSAAQPRGPPALS